VDSGISGGRRSGKRADALTNLQRVLRNARGLSKSRLASALPRDQLRLRFCEALVAPNRLSAVFGTSDVIIFVWRSVWDPLYAHSGEQQLKQ
jgi:hypothetical protein